MRFRAVSVIITLIVIFGSQIPVVTAETAIMLDEDDVLLEPVVFGNMTTGNHWSSLVGLSVTGDGRMFTVSEHPLSRYIHGPTEVSLIAWENNGTVLWSVITTHFDRKYYGVTNDESFVYVVGRYELDILVEKYDFEGNLAWNKTIDLGQTEEGYEIIVMEDGTIIIGGARWQGDLPSPIEHFLLALDQTGQIQWGYDYERYPSPSYDSGNLYITTGSLLQKLDSTGSILWSVECSEERLGCANEDIVYTIDSLQYIERYTNPSSMFMLWNYADIAITSWSSDTGGELISSNLRLFSATREHFNTSREETEVDQDGAIWLLMQAREFSSWYLIKYNPMTELTSIHKVIDFEDVSFLDLKWNWISFSMDSSGNAYLASNSESFGYIVMKFDSSQLTSTETSSSTSTTATTTGPNGFTEPIDSTMIALAFAAVVIIDAVLILVLKERWSGRK
ncbi:MAG: hypothetical protein ACW99X_11905 [Candidatus Thorarchaeota archaeon]